MVTFSETFSSRKEQGIFFHSLKKGVVDFFLKHNWNHISPSEDLSRNAPINFAPKDNPDNTTAIVTFTNDGFFKGNENEGDPYLWIKLTLTTGS